MRPTNRTTFTLSLILACLIAVSPTYAQGAGGTGGTGGGGSGGGGSGGGGSGGGGTDGGPLEITINNYGEAVIGQEFESPPLTATGGTGPYSWSISSTTFTLPWLKLGTSAAGNDVLEGMPTLSVFIGSEDLPADLPFMITLTDSSVPALQVTETVTIFVEESYYVSTLELPTASFGQFYDVKLNVKGGIGPYKWSIKKGPSGDQTLPPGLSLNGDRIQGFPQDEDSRALIFCVDDNSFPTLAAERQLTIETKPDVIVSHNPAFKQSYVEGEDVGTIGFTATGGINPYTWSAQGLPAGLVFDNSILTGTIAEGAAQAEAYEVVFTACDSSDPEAYCGSQTVEFYVYEDLGIRDLDLGTALEGRAYQSQPFTVAGGEAPYNVELSGIPEAITLTAQRDGSFILSGTAPVGTGRSIPYQGTFTVTDSSTPAQTFTASFDFLLLAQLKSLTAVLPVASAGSPYDLHLEAQGGIAPYNWELNGLPEGMTLDENTDEQSWRITGTPTPAMIGSHIVSISLHDSSEDIPQDDATRLNLIVTSGDEPEPLTFTTTSLPQGLMFESYTSSVQTSGGTPPYTWNVKGLPQGIEANPLGSDLVLSGQPLVAGSYLVHVVLSDAGATAREAIYALGIRDNSANDDSGDSSTNGLGNSFSQDQLTSAAAGCSLNGFHEGWVWLLLTLAAGIRFFFERSGRHL